MRIGRHHVPGAVRELIGKLALLPGDEAGDEARVARLAANDVVDRLLLDGGIESRHHDERSAARARAALDQREDQLRPHRAAEVYGLAYSLRRRVLGEHLAERHVGRAIDDEPDVLAAAERRDHQYRAGVD